MENPYCSCKLTRVCVKEMLSGLAGPVSCGLQLQFLWIVPAAAVSLHARQGAAEPEGEGGGEPAVQLVELVDGTEMVDVRAAPTP